VSGTAPLPFVRYLRGMARGKHVRDGGTVQLTFARTYASSSRDWFATHRALGFPAGRCLKIVQPALSMQIRALEEELGGPLFLRTSRRLQLTEAGMLLREEARRTLEQAEHTGSPYSGRYVVRRAPSGWVFPGNAVFSGKLIKRIIVQVG
jgi:hypothetical protein